MKELVRKMIRELNALVNELLAYNLPKPYIAECVVGFGDKQEILNVLQDE